MTPAPLHRAEAARLAAVHDLRLLDTAAEARFDRLTELASMVLGTPIALITLVDQERQWFKSRVGLDSPQTPRDVAFCAHVVALDSDDAFVVEDATVDARFSDNPLVTGEPGIRFYAGQVIRHRDGMPVGTLCAIDRRPRVIDAEQRRALRHLAGLVEQELERRDDQQLTAALAASERTKSLILDTLGEGLLLVDRSGRVVEWNVAAERVLGVDAATISASAVLQQLWGPADQTGCDEGVDGTGRPDGRVTAHRRPDGSDVWIRINRQPIVDEDGNPDGALVALADVTAETESRRRAGELEEQLRDSEAAARVSLDSLEQGVIFADKDARIRRLNPAAERILGFTAEELSARWLRADWTIYDESGHVIPADRRPIHRAMSTGTVVTGAIVVWPGRNGGRIVLRMSCIPNVDGAGGLVIAFTDVTAERRAQRLLDATLDTAPVGLAILDNNGRIRRCNAVFAEQAGMREDELVGRDVVGLLHPDDRDEAELLADVLRSGATDRGGVEHRVLRPDGSEIWVSTHLAVLTDPDQPLAIAATFDITSQRKMILDLSRFDHLFRNASDIIIVAGADGQVQYASPSAGRLLGYAAGHRPAGGIFALVHPDDVARAEGLFRALRSGRPDPEPFLVRVRDGMGAWHHLECIAANLLDEPAVQGIVVTARDATERVELVEQLAHRAHHDALTDLPNRQLLHLAITDALRRNAAAGKSTAVCFIDLDGFKGVNDRLGHAVGDELLIAVAERLRRAIREGDTAARLGGDEFVVLLDGVTDRDQAKAVADRARDGINELRATFGVGSEFGASIGIAISNRADSPATLLARADSALYRAKSSHDSAIAFATPATG